MEKLNACMVHVKNAKIDLKYQRELAQTYEKDLAETHQRYNQKQSVSMLKVIFVLTKRT